MSEQRNRPKSGPLESCLGPNLRPSDHQRAEGFRAGSCRSQRPLLAAAASVALALLLIASPPARASCPADCGPTDGVVDVFDMLTLLSQWGAGGTCDLTGDGVVRVFDLLMLLESWGPCPDDATNSCAGRCGGTASSGCSCSLACGHYPLGPGCCEDVCVHCPHFIPCAQSCEEFCGGATPLGCWCDDVCVNFGDCCLDICDHCDHDWCP